MRNARPRGSAVALACAAAALALAPPASAVTITLGRQSLSESSSSIGCFANQSCINRTVGTLKLTGGANAAAPADGVVIGWRIRGTTVGTGRTRLQLIRPTSGGKYVPVSFSDYATSVSGDVNGTSQPIQVGDYVGLLLGSNSTSSTNDAATVQTISAPGALYADWRPLLGDEREPTALVPDVELMFNADVLLAVPVVTGVSPSSASATGGDTVTITGDHLANASQVSFGDTPAPSFSGDNTHITATVPAAPGGTVDVRVTAPGGTSGTSDATKFTLIPPPPDLVAPAITDLALSRSAFSAAASGPSVVAARAIGTNVYYTLTEAATMTFTVQRATTGRRRSRKCVSGRPSRRYPRCTRYVDLPNPLSVPSGGGVNGFRFTGRLGDKRLRAGAYRLVAVATDAAGNRSKSVARPFRIVK